MDYLHAHKIAFARHPATPHFRKRAQHNFKADRVHIAGGIHCWYLVLIDFKPHVRLIEH